MGMTVKGAGLAREEGVEKRRVTVALSDLAFEAAMGDEADDPSQAPLRIESALRCYLGDKGTGRAAWPYPGFLRGSETRRDVEVELDLEADLWHTFEEEATGQGLMVDQLVEHAVFYFAAELDAGRLTQRILEDLESIGGDEES
jgi:hypothetical protein